MTAAENAGPDTIADLRPAPDRELEALRDILLKQDRQQAAQNQAELKALEQRINDKDALITTITPVLGDAIRVKIRDSRDEMIEALYPIIGRLVVRAWWGGVSSAELALRESLPFEVTEVLMIHRSSGLLLQHVSRDPRVLEDSEIISSMLTAIRDFTAEAFGRGQQGSLDSIEYGDRRILIEAAEHAYLAVVVEGVEPAGFRAEMREQMMKLESDYADVLRHYDGDSARLAFAAPLLRSWVMGTQGGPSVPGDGAG